MKNELEELKTCKENKEKKLSRYILYIVLTTTLLGVTIFQEYSLINYGIVLNKDIINIIIQSIEFTSFLTDLSLAVIAANTKQEITLLDKCINNIKIELSNQKTLNTPNKVIEKQESREENFKIYVIIDTLNNLFFNTIQELNEYLQKNNISPSIVKAYIIEYKRYFAGMKDVIKLTDNNTYTSKYLCAIDKDSYIEYNHERSIYNKEHTWDYYYGSYLKPIYEELKNRSIRLEEDIYEDLQEKHEKIKKLVRTK